VKETRVNKTEQSSSDVLSPRRISARVVWPPGGDGLLGGKISECCLVIYCINDVITRKL